MFASLIAALFGHSQTATLYSESQDIALSVAVFRQELADRVAEHKARIDKKQNATADLINRLTSDLVELSVLKQIADGISL